MHGAGSVRWKPTTMLHRGKVPSARLAYQRAVKDRKVSLAISEALGYRAARAVEYFMAQEMWQEGLDLAAHILSPEQHTGFLQAFCRSGEMKVIFEAVALRQLLNIPMDECDPTLCLLQVHKILCWAQCFAHATDPLINMSTGRCVT
jgi:hypothetical protein